MEDADLTAGSSGTEPIRVMIVEDHRVVADGLALAIDRDPGLQTVGIAETAAEARRLAAQVRPHVVLMDYHLPDGTGAEVANAIRTELPQVAVVVLTADGGDDALLSSVEAGATGYLLKSQAAAQVVNAVRRAAEGEMLIPAAVLARLLGHQREVGERKRREEQLREALTAREQEVLNLMARGLDNRAIAEQLVVSYTTVRTHVQNTLDKLGAHSKLEAVARATELGLLGS
jgi:DNA-binding NarL/FixJ family response regulator